MEKQPKEKKAKCSPPWIIIKERTLSKVQEAMQMLVGDSVQMYSSRRETAFTHTKPSIKVAEKNSNARRREKSKSERTATEKAKINFDLLERKLVRDE